MFRVIILVTMIECVVLLGVHFSIAPTTYVAEIYAYVSASMY